MTRMKSVLVETVGPAQAVRLVVSRRFSPHGGAASAGDSGEQVYTGTCQDIGGVQACMERVAMETSETSFVCVLKIDGAGIFEQR